jgi:hypothetical protein
MRPAAARWRAFFILPANILRAPISLCSGGTVRRLERSRLRNIASDDVQPARKRIQEREAMSLGTILIIILVIALLGGFSGLGGGPFYGTGYYGGGGLGLVLLIIVVLVVLGRI